MRLGFVKKSGDATLRTNLTTLVRGGDTVGRTVVVGGEIIFSEGQSIKLTIEKVDGAAPQSLADNFCFGIFIPDDYC